MAIANKKETKRRGRWKKGESGNPSGRPRESHELKELARSHGEHCINRLVELTKDKNGKVAVTACSILLDRGYGKAVQTIEGGGAPPAISPHQEVINSMPLEKLRALKQFLVAAPIPTPAALPGPNKPNAPRDLGRH
jgi:hypothetical protein